ncbi:E3 ubiquitin-protein ligase RING1-like [Linum perenne]
MMSSRYDGAQCIDGVMVFDGVTAPPRVSRTATVRRTPATPFHSRNPDIHLLQLQAAFTRASQQLNAAAAVAAESLQSSPYYGGGGRTAPESHSAGYRVPVSSNLSRPHFIDTVHQRFVRVMASPVSPAVVIRLPAPAPPRGRRNQPRRYYREEDVELMAAVAASEEEYEIRTIGASDSAIEKLERLESFEGEDCCTICLEEMIGAGQRVIRLECKHVFHESCLVPWIRNSNCCPLCRFQIPD